MNIRQATEEDIEAIRKVAEAAWENDYPEILSRETVDAGVEEWYELENIEADLKMHDAILLVAEVDDEVVGFAHAIWARRTGHILRVYVLPDYRQRGIGGELLASVRDTLLRRGADRIQAMVLAENEQGNAFYESFGFEKVDEGETLIGDKSYKENVYVRKR